MLGSLFGLVTRVANIPLEVADVVVNTTFDDDGRKLSMPLNEVARSLESLDGDRVEQLPRRR